MLINFRFNKPLLVIYLLSAYTIVLVIRSVFFSNKSTPTTIPIFPEKLVKFSPKSLPKTSDSLSNLSNDFIKQNILQNQAKNASIIYFNRVPKCASTTMILLMQNLKNKNRFDSDFAMKIDIEPGWRHYLDSEREYSEFFDRLAEIYKSEREVQNNNARYLLYIRHLHFVNFDQILDENHMKTQNTMIDNYPLIKNSNIKYFNIIRNPIDQYISTYYFQRHGFEGKAYAPEWLIDKSSRNFTKKETQQTISECIKNKAPECINIYSDMIPYFCGNYEFCRHRNRKALELAKNNILHHFTFVGILEEFDKTLFLLEKLVPEVFLVKNNINANHDSLKNQNINNLKDFYHSQHFQDVLNNAQSSKTADKPVKEPEWVREYLREKLQVEMELYEFVRELLFKKYQVFVDYQL